jgi:proteasome accessory factor B
MAAQTDWKQEPDDQSERLYSLTLALVQTEYGLTKDEIFTSIRGYRLDLEKAGGFHADLSALNKKFDRDKEKLRELGVQISPAQNSNEGDTDYRYQISRDIFVWPEGTRLTAKQLQLLELAASIWDRAALSPEANNALTRLRAIAEVGSPGLGVGINPRINTVEPSFGPIKRAIEDHVRVSFLYRKPDGVEESREIEPWQLSHIDGAWMVLGFDVQRKAPRNFLLRRIHSKVSRSRTEFGPPEASQITQAKSELADLYEDNVAVLKVHPGTTAAMHFETHNSPEGIARVNFLDLELMAEEILEFGTAVEVLEPASLKQAIRKTLQQVIDSHA